MTKSDYSGLITVEVCGFSSQAGCCRGCGSEFHCHYGLAVVYLYIQSLRTHTPLSFIFRLFETFIKQDTSQRQNWVKKQGVESSTVVVRQQTLESMVLSVRLGEKSGTSDFCYSSSSIPFYSFCSLNKHFYLLFLCEKLSSVSSTMLSSITTTCSDVSAGLPSPSLGISFLQFLNSFKWVE